MPVIAVQMLSGRTPEQKSAFIQQVTEVATRTLDVPPQAVTIVLTEVSAEHWGSGGRTMAAIRAAQAPTPAP